MLLFLIHKSMGMTAKYLYENCSLYIIPMINPDGINLVNNFYSIDSEVYISAHNIAKNYPDIPFPSGWKANINGVDLNSQFPANWKLGKKIKSNLGFNKPAPRVCRRNSSFRARVTSHV